MPVAICQAAPVAHIQADGFSPTESAIVNRRLNWINHDHILFSVQRVHAVRSRARLLVLTGRDQGVHPPRRWRMGEVEVKRRPD